ncbi:MAG: Isoprenyl transferase [Candidatus Amesbacteria bacterium GW2011_GWC1_48_10]|uniref:Isoprenyl transferase n=3 Tax=Candidatus Amesiibacteriota TaxID=1752730 RepID=A0A0G1WNJ5_9BACT|nr:MAG: Isoprenyl transferase [Candidatus Amesbacteria bacterium GW2011_GWC1_48_10]
MAAMLTLPEGTKVPDHVVYIPDGNRRWARARGLPPIEGHRAGFENTLRLMRATRSWGIHTVTGWGLSTENWLERPKNEVEFLMRGMVRYLDKYLDEAQKEGIRVVHLGRKDRLPRVLLDKLAEVEEKTRGNAKHIYNLALDYNGPDEIMRAVKRIIADGIRPEQVDRKLMDSYMDTAGQPYPYPDLIIRTSGEQRTSGILQWQSDYAEMYWEPDHFPDFSPAKLREAILDYSRRRRRFGGNDAMEHLAFKPQVMAKLELDFRRALGESDNKKLSDLVIKYVREQYGLSKGLAKTAGLGMARALRSGQQKDWESAKKALKGLYEVIKHNVGLAFEPELVANIEVNLWRGKQTEEETRQLVAEKYRLSNFQANKSAHLAYLASMETQKGNWERAKWYMEKYYEALKERVA